MTTFFVEQAENRVEGLKKLSRKSQREEIDERVKYEFDFKKNFLIKEIRHLVTRGKNNDH